MNRFFTLVFILSSTFLQAQQANIWYFGNQAGLDFNQGSPQGLTDGQTDFPSCCGWNESTSVISDSNGELLFYSNGEKVWNRLHEIMPNSIGLLGHASSTQSSIIIPLPGNDHLFYLFTTDAEENNYINGFRYSIIDMCLDNEKGDIDPDNKDVLLLNNATEKLIAVQHNNGQDYWIITHELDTDAFYAFLLTSNGITQSTTSNVSIPHLVGTGQMAASPNGQKIALACPNGFSQNGVLYEGFTYLLDFNTSTGVISNSQSLQTSDPRDYGVCFSPDNSKLYFSTVGLGNLYQYDLDAGSIQNIISSKTYIIQDEPDNLRQMAIGPDGKIYLSRTGKEFISVLEAPNNIGLDCNYIENAIDLQGKKASFGLPNFVAGFQYNNELVPSCTTTANTEVNISTNLFLYPNPTSGKIYISNLPSKNTSIQITDALGKIIWTKENFSENSLDISSFNAGVYYVCIMNKEETSLAKIVKQ